MIQIGKIDFSCVGKNEAFTQLNLIDDELARGDVTIKSLVDGEDQLRVPLDQVAGWLLERSII